MTRSKTFVAATLTSITLAAALTLAPSLVGARSIGDDSAAALRIADAFAFPQGKAVDPAIQAAATRAQKGDLSVRVARDASTASHRVTIGYQSGEAETVLVRMPSLRVAAR